MVLIGSDNLVINILTVLIATLVLIILFFKRKFRYWKDMGVEAMEPTIPFGNASEMFSRKISQSEGTQKIYNYFKSRNFKYGGFYLVYLPVFVPIDLDLIKRIMQTDFSHFTDHIGFMNEEIEPLTAHLFALGGQRWRNLRIKLTPTFTSGKMKYMFPIVVKASEELVKVLQKECDNKIPIESRDISARYSTDVICTSAFGIEGNSLADPNSDFRVYGKRLFNLNVIESLQLITGVVCPSVFKLFRFRQFPKVATDFFWNVIKDTVDYREKTGFRRNDAVQLLIDMKAKDGSDNGEFTLTFNELAAQAFIYFGAGFDTSSSAMSFALLELALNQEVQNTLREEINSVINRNNNEFTYIAMQEMKYLDMVINEALRKYSPFGSLMRTCTKDYHIPDSNVVLIKGTNLLIPIHGIHHDPESYPDPEKFDPIRFSEENKHNRPQFAFLPFGEGPRSCIGIRFGMMQIKTGLLAIIRNFRIKVNPRTTTPVKLDPKLFVTAALGDVLLDLEKID